MPDDAKKSSTLLTVLLVIGGVFAIACCGFASVVSGLVGVAGWNVRAAANTADIARAKADLSSLEHSLEMFKFDVGSYPASYEGLQSLVTPPADPAVTGRWKGPYAESIPQDPWGNPYSYALITAETLKIWSVGPDKTEGTADDVTN